MKKGVLVTLGVIMILGMAYLAVNYSLQSGHSELRNNEALLAKGNIDAANRLLADMKTKYDSDVAGIEKLQSLAEEHKERAIAFKARLMSLPPDEKTRSLIYAQRLFMMETRQLYMEYQSLSYNALSFLENTIREWRRHSEELSDSYNQLVYYSRLYSPDDQKDSGACRSWQSVEDSAVAMQMEHEKVFKDELELLLSLKQKQAHFQEETSVIGKNVMSRTLWWKIDPLLSPNMLRFLRTEIITSPRQLSMDLSSAARSIPRIGSSFLRYMETTIWRQGISLAAAMAFLFVITMLAGYLSRFAKKWPDGRIRSVIFFERFLSKRRFALSAIVYILTATHLTLFPFPDVHIVIKTLWILLPIWCIIGAVDVLLPLSGDNVIYGIMTTESRKRARRALFVILWSQMVGWFILILTKTYNLGYPYSEALVSTALDSVVFFSAIYGISRGLKNNLPGLDAKKRALTKLAAELFILLFGILTVMDILGYINLANLISYNIWATISAITLGSVMLSVATALLAYKLFPELLDFRQRNVSRFALLTSSSSSLYDKHKESDFRMMAVHFVDFILATAILIAVAAALAVVWNFKFGWIQKAFLSPCLPLVKTQVPSFGEISICALILFVTHWLSNNIKTILTRICYEPAKYPMSAQYTTTLLIKYAIWVIGTAMALGYLNFGWEKLQWLVAALGVGVGFGLQEIVSNFISGLILLFERPIKVNDYISMDQINGVVEDIQIRSTTIRTFNNISVIVPNKDLIMKQIVNLTHNDDIIRLNIPVGVAYGSDLKKVERVLLDIANENKHVLKIPAPSVILKEFGDSAIVFLLRPHIDDARKDLIIQSELNTEISRQFAASGIVIPFPQRDIFIHQPGK
jgi:small-conductance mechanosensitive channel